MNVVMCKVLFSEAKSKMKHKKLVDISTSIWGKMKKARLVSRKWTFLGKPAFSIHCEMSSADLFFSLIGAHVQIILNSPDYKKT